MKPLSVEKLTSLLIILLGLTLGVGCGDQTSENTKPDTRKAELMVITSPRHARTFDVTGNDKLSQDLRWNPDTQMLSAFVTYSLVSGGGDAELDPANCRVIELPFPGIKLDKDRNLFALDSRNRKVFIGHLGKGVFGTKVVLNDNVRLSAHRLDKMLSGRLIVSAE